MRIVFMGTPEYAVASLERLIASKHEVVGVFTQPDRPHGRKGNLRQPPAKVLALSHQIPVFQPERIGREGLPMLLALAPDLCVTAAFGQILSQEILDVPPQGTVNVHASLLPAYRGSSPIHWAIIKGEKQTGVTTMMTDRGIDTGDILLQRKTDIGPMETAGELTDRLASLGADLLMETLEQIEQGKCQRAPQDNSRMSYYPMLTKQLGAIDWALPATEIANLVRGLNPWPGAFSDSPHGVMKIHLANAEKTDAFEAEPGQVLVSDPKEGLVIATGEGALRLVSIQMPGGKAMDPKVYLLGHPLPVGSMMRKEEAGA